MRPRSLAGPIILIVLGGVFLLNNFFPGFSFWEVFMNYWPFLLIAFGVIRLLEVLVDAGRARPLPVRSISGGQIVLLIALCFLAYGVTRRDQGIRFGRIFAGNNDFFGAQYDYPVTQKKPIGGAKRLVIDNLRGNITITGADTDEIEIEGHKMVRAYNQRSAEQENRGSSLELVPQGDQMTLRVKETRGGDRRISTDLEIHVPRSMSVDARVRSGDLSISAVEGSVDASTSRGDVRLNDIGGNARIEARRSGLVRAVDLKGSLDVQGNGTDIQLDNIAGQATINGSYGGSLEFRNLAKPLHFESQNTDLRVEKIPGTVTMSLGDFRANNVVGPLRFVTRARDIQIEDFSDTIDLDVDRGDITLKPGKAPLAKIDVHSRNGNIELSLPEKAAFTLKATTAQGEAENDYGPAVQMETEGRSATLKSVDGKGPSITVSTDRGTVTVRKS